MTAENDGSALPAELMHFNTSQFNCMDEERNNKLYCSGFHFVFRQHKDTMRLCFVRRKEDNLFMHFFHVFFPLRRIQYRILLNAIETTPGNVSTKMSRFPSQPLASITQSPFHNTTALCAYITKAAKELVAAGAVYVVRTGTQMHRVQGE